MSIVFSCPCGKELRTGEQNAGRKVRCPGCGEMQTVPSADTIAREAPPEKRLNREERGPRDREERSFRAGVDDRLSEEAGGTSGKAIVALILGLASFLGSILFGLPAVVLGIWSISDVNKSKGRFGGKGLAVSGIVLGLLGCVCSVPVGVGGFLFLVGNPFARVMEAAERAVSNNNMKQIGIAMSSHELQNGSYPAGAIYGKQDGKPKLSWRVALLPALGHEQLYRKFHLDEPWDSPHNLTLLPQMPPVYAAPASRGQPPDHTFYRIFHAQDPLKAPLVDMPVFMGMQEVKETQFIRGKTNTIMVVEAAESVPWTKPDELPFPVSGQVEPLLGGASEKGYHVLFADGHVSYYLKGTVSDRALKAAITINSSDTERMP